MNILDKFLLEETEAAPYIYNNKKFRERSEIFIFNERNEICMGSNKRKDGSIYYTFPGGGLNQGETSKEATIRESMEEIGVVPKDISSIGTPLIISWEELYGNTTNIPSSLPKDKIGQDGMVTYFFTGNFDKYNYDKYGDDGDQGKCIWKSIKDHISRINSNINDADKEKDKWLIVWWQKELSLLNLLNCTKMKMN